MFRWFRTLVRAHGRQFGEREIEATIVQVQQCRLVMSRLLEELRLARQLLETTEHELSDEMGRIKARQNLLEPVTFDQDFRQRESAHG